MLAERVDSGKLPAVEERLPKNPFVRHVPQIGKCGGTMYDQSGTPGGRFHFDGALIAGAQETDNDVQIIRPHLCDHVDVSADFREFTFHIREGLKWTDGVDLTADDVLWWQHEQRNPIIFPEGPRTFKVGNDFAEFSKLGPWTLRIAFPTSFRLGLNIPASEWMAFGSHFAERGPWMKQFHADFNPKANEVARQNGFGACYQYYTMMMQYMQPVVNKPHVGLLVSVGLDDRARYLRTQPVLRRGRSGG